MGPKSAFKREIDKDLKCIVIIIDIDWSSFGHFRQMYFYSSGLWTSATYLLCFMRNVRHLSPHHQHIIDERTERHYAERESYFLD